MAGKSVAKFFLLLALAKTSSRFELDIETWPHTSARPHLDVDPVAIKILHGERVASSRSHDSNIGA